MQPTYKRVLLKLSGEALEGGQGHGIAAATLESVARQVKEVCELGAQLAIVIGGGNLFRGLSGVADGMDRTIADTMGMLATTINCLALHDALGRIGQRSRVLSAIPMGQVADTFTKRQAVGCLEAGEVVLLAAGTGNPYFTTDSAAALRALELDAEVLLKATKVDGIYDKDPAQHPDAVRFRTLSYQEILERQLRVMDLTAITLCRDNRLPLIVFDLGQAGNIKRVILGEEVGSQVRE